MHGKPKTAVEVLDDMIKAQELLHAQESDLWTLIAPNGLIFRGTVEQILTQVAQIQAEAYARQPISFTDKE